MNITTKNILSILLPGLLVITGDAIDRSFKWRAEVEQKEQDRQIRILDTIMEAPLEKRIAIAEFYLKTNAFRGSYREELEASLTYAKAEKDSATTLMLTSAVSETVGSPVRALPSPVLAPPPPIQEDDEETPINSVSSMMKPIPRTILEKDRTTIFSK